MASKYTDNQLEYIKDNVSIECVSELVTGEVSYDGRILCPNPDHDDTDPSFTIDGQVGHCFSCTYSGNVIQVTMALKKINFIEAVDWLVKEFNLSISEQSKKPKVTRKKKGKVSALLSKEQYIEVKNNSSIKGNMYRGIRDEILKRFGTRTEYNEKGDVTGRWYAITENCKPACLKKRLCDKEYLASIGKKKSFISIGRLANSNDLFGLSSCYNGGKIALICGGEEDAMAAQDMIDAAWKKFKWAKASKPHCLSPTLGESECYKQLQNNYTTLDKFEEIIVAFDADEAGQKAIEKAIPALPKGKIYTIEWREKDPNEYLVQGKEEEFIQDYWKKKKWIPVGIVTSGQLRQAVLEEIQKDKITLPPFLRQLENMLGGGFTQGRIVNLVAASGVGKTSFVNELNYYWYFNSPYLPLTVSLELSKGQYGLEIYSRHLGINLSGIKDHKTQIKILEDRDEEIKQLEYTEDGDPRFLLIDDRDGTIEDLQDKIEEATVSSGAGVIVFDPVSDIFDSEDLKTAEAFVKWQKSIVKSHNVLIVNIVHVNKTNQGTFFNDKGELTWPRGDILHGTSTLFKSASVNVYLARNTYAKNDIEKNTTHLLLPKNRIGRVTGECGKVFYEASTHRLHDFDTYWEERG